MATADKGRPSQDLTNEELVPLNWRIGLLPPAPPFGGVPSGCKFAGPPEGEREARVGMENELERGFRDLGGFEAEGKDARLAPGGVGNDCSGAPPKLEGEGE